MMMMIVMMIDVLRATSKGNETPLGYAHAEIRTQVVVICGPTRYQLDHGGDQVPFDKAEVMFTHFHKPVYALLSKQIRSDN